MTSPARGAADRGTFRSLRVRNFRLFAAGHAVSQSGSWLQLVALSWVALTLTGRGTALGWMVAVTFAPLVLLAPWVGSVTDRSDTRRLLIAVHIAGTAHAITLAALVLGGGLTVPLLYLMALGHGIVHAAESPVRRAFVAETVDQADLANAVSLTSTLSAACRVAGPALGGVLLVGPGAGWCFVANAVSSVLALFGLVLIRRAELAGTAPDADGGDGSVRAGLAYAWSVPELRVTLLATAVVCTLGFNHPVITPLLAERTFGGGAGLYTLLYTALAGGGIAGGLLAARRRDVDLGHLARATLAFGGATALVAMAPTVAWATAATVVAGATGLLVVCTSAALLQLRCEPALRGRMMALSAVVVAGGTPIGAPLLGWLSETAGPRAGLATAAAGCAITGACVLTRGGARTPMTLALPRQEPA